MINRENLEKNIGFSLVVLVLSIISSIFSLAVLILKVELLIFFVFVATHELGISYSFGIFLLLLSVKGTHMNFPLYIGVLPRISIMQYLRGFCTIGLKRRRTAFFEEKFMVYSYWCINLVGGVIPTALALYQFIRKPHASVLIVTAVIAVIAYFLVNVNTLFISLKNIRLYFISLFAVFIAFLTLPLEMRDLVPSVAFAGGVLGTLIGGDLLHLREAEIPGHQFGVIVGGAGFRDVIVKCGIMALLLGKCLLYGIEFLYK